MYTGFYQNILFPFYETFLRRRSTIKYLNSLRSTQWLSKDELKHLQWQKVKKLLDHAYANVPYYTNLFKKKRLHPGDIKTPQDYEQIPFLTKEDIRSNQNLLVAVNYKQSALIDKSTGGSTGTPLQLKLDRTNEEHRMAVAQRTYGWAGYRDGSKAVYIWGEALVPQPFWKKVKYHIHQHMVKRHRVYNAFTLNKERMSRCMKEINSYRPEYIVAYVSALYNFTRFVKETGNDIVSPRAILVGAERLFPSQRALIEDVFQCPVFETYGCREFSAVAGECERHDGMHVNMENFYVEIVNGNSAAACGENGEVVITDLTNYPMPFIRYKNDDVGSFSDKQCSCGRGLRMLEKIEGRTLDSVKTVDGRVIWGGCFVYLMWDISEIEQFQIVQDDLRQLKIKIVKRQEVPQDKLENVKKIMQEVLGDTIGIHFEFVDTIALTRTGKLRVVVSNIPWEVH